VLTELPQIICGGKLSPYEIRERENDGCSTHTAPEQAISEHNNKNDIKIVPMHGLHIVWECFGEN
jgi:hypothetical protein